MSQAIVDPEELRRFANNLKRFHAELQGQMLSLGGQLKALGNTWWAFDDSKLSESERKALLLWLNSTLGTATRRAWA